ncbi:hypothetical protein M513_02058 [Trichuris suis]|uniref:Uncharacterized protein n=1 Tax=Trichuris suis TaxID=68888 RepID=A0A085MIX7_9BILA|nr:hypothetical protein M513_02058 [Trichuris suis]
MLHMPCPVSRTSFAPARSRISSSSLNKRALCTKVQVEHASGRRRGSGKLKEYWKSLKSSDLVIIKFRNEVMRKSLTRKQKKLTDSSNATFSKVGGMRFCHPHWRNPSWFYLL